jgi:hypothetical protein
MNMDSTQTGPGRGEGDQTYTNVLDGAARPAGVWGHLLVSASACILTVSIVGSAVFLTYRIYSRQQLRVKVQAFIGSLQNRTPQELEDRVTQLKQRPKLAEYVLPELRRTLRTTQSESQLRAAISLARAFLDDRKVESAVFGLRDDRRESISGAAVEALGRTQPPAHAAELLGRCLEGANAGQVSPAAVDAACAGLFALGGPGAGEMQKRLSVLSPARKSWLVGYVDSVGGPYRQTWLGWLAADENAAVRSAAKKALASPSAGQAVAPALESSPNAPPGA